MSGSLMEEIRFSPHMHAVFHGNVTKDYLTLPLLVKRMNINCVEIRDSSEDNPYYLATLYHGAEATQKQVSEAVENLKAILTLRFA